MPRYKGRNYFVVKHDLASFQALPGYIWNSGYSKGERPVGFRIVEKGDRWISFAYTTSGAREKAVSLVTGYYKCTKECRYGKLPPKPLAIAEGKKGAWLIKGDSLCTPLPEPVVVPPLSSFLGKKLFHRRTITRISPAQFEKIRAYTIKHRFRSEKIPCLARHPRNEQEVLAIVASNPEQFGIRRIVRVQTRFPDMLVKLKGKADEVHLELELYSSSFLNHGHEKQVHHDRFRYKRYGKVRGDGRPVGVLCWINDDQDKVVERHVHDIFEIQDLLKHRKPIRW
jgi:hypothetical protein